MTNDSNGSLNYLPITVAKELYNSDQSRFEDFTEEDTTVIAAVRHPEDVPDLADEHIPDLGLPWHLRSYFTHMRQEYQDFDNLSPAEAHERAFEECEIHEKFGDYVWWDESDITDENFRTDEYRVKIKCWDLAERVKEHGENILLIADAPREGQSHAVIIVQKVHQLMNIISSYDESEEMIESIEDGDIHPEEMGYMDLDDLREELGLSLKTELTDFQ